MSFVEEMRRITREARMKRQQEFVRNVENGIREAAEEGRYYAIFAFDPIQLSRVGLFFSELVMEQQGTLTRLSWYPKENTETHNEK